jgi:hypothetical protein
VCKALSTPSTIPRTRACWWTSYATARRRTNETRAAAAATLLKRVPPDNPWSRLFAVIPDPKEPVMQNFSIRRPAARYALATLVIALGSAAAIAADAPKGIEQALTAAQQDKRGITVYVSGQTIGGAVTRVEPGQWVEMKNQTSGKIIVRLDRIDAIAAP